MKKLLASISLCAALVAGFGSSQADAAVLTFDSYVQAGTTTPGTWTYHLTLDANETLAAGTQIKVVTNAILTDVSADTGSGLTGSLGAYGSASNSVAIWTVDTGGISGGTSGLTINNLVIESNYRDPITGAVFGSAADLDYTIKTGTGVVIGGGTVAQAPSGTLVPNSGPNITPEPSTAMLIGIAGLCMRGMQFVKRRKTSVPA